MYQSFMFQYAECTASWQEMSASIITEHARNARHSSAAAMETLPCTDQDFSGMLCGILESAVQIHNGARCTDQVASLTLLC